MRYASSASPSRPSPPVRHERTWLASCAHFACRSGVTAGERGCSTEDSATPAIKWPASTVRFAITLILLSVPPSANAVERCTSGGASCALGCLTGSGPPSASHSGKVAEAVSRAIGGSSAGGGVPGAMCSLRSADVAIVMRQLL